MKIENLNSSPSYLKHNIEQDELFLIFQFGNYYFASWDPPGLGQLTVYFRPAHVLVARTLPFRAGRRVAGVGAVLLPNLKQFTFYTSRVWLCILGDS